VVIRAGSAALLALVAGLGCGEVAGDAILGAPLPGPATRIVDNQLEPVPLVVADGYLYWVNNDPYLGSLLRLPLGGGPVETLASQQDTAVLSFAVGSTAAYFPANGAVLSVPIGGGAITTLVSVHTIAVLADATSVYACEQLGDGNGGLALDAIPLGGGSPRRLATLPGFDPVSGFVLSGGTLYVTGALQHAVASVAASGSAPVFLDVDGRAIASDGQTLFFADPSAGSVGAIPLGGGPALTLATGLAGPDAVAVDDAFVYFSTAGQPPLLSRVPKGGGQLEPLATTHAQVRAIAVGDQAIYFADPADGTLLALGH
jgi:hypothetical protein